MESSRALELITFKSSAGLHLDGLLFQKDNYRKTIIHVHGSYGNFYQNHFLRLMARQYTDSGINFLSFNLAGHDGFGEGYRNAEDFAVTRDGKRLVTRDCADCLRQLDIAHHRESKKRRLK